MICQDESTRSGNSGDRQPAGVDGRRTAGFRVLDAGPGGRLSGYLYRRAAPDGRRDGGRAGNARCAERIRMMKESSVRFYEDRNLDLQ